MAFSRRFFSFQANDIVILSAVRTPIGSFRGSLASLSAIELGAHAVKAAVARAGIKAGDVDQVVMGNCLPAGLGQAPARQVILKAGLENKTVVTTINKLCASGMKSVMFGAGLLRLGEAKVMVAGGFESMSNAPFLLPTMRNGTGYGHVQALDSVLNDGLTDAYDKIPMGQCCEKTAVDYSITRDQSDAYALESYVRAQAAVAGKLFEEIAPVEIVSKKGNVTVSSDEEIPNLKRDKIATLKSVFKKDGTITVFNASKLNDGAAALILTTGQHAKELGVKPIARILGWGDAAAAPIDFPTAPVLAIPVSLKHANLSLKDIDLFELNEAFSTVPLAAMKALGIKHDQLNVLGGAVAMGHPIGCSGARIITTLLSALKYKNKKVGLAAICNGGGGASSIIVERL